MPDREKVIRAVDSCFNYWLEQHRWLHPLELENVRKFKADALAILKEQEAVAPFYEEEDILNYFKNHTLGRCGHCKAPLPALDGLRSKFCWMCGSQVKWDG